MAKHVKPHTKNNEQTNGWGEEVPKSPVLKKTYSLIRIHIQCTYLSLGGDPRLLTLCREASRPKDTPVAPLGLGYLVRPEECSVLSRDWKIHQIIPFGEERLGFWEYLAFDWQYQSHLHNQTAQFGVDKHVILLGTVFVARRGLPMCTTLSHVGTTCVFDDLCVKPAKNQPPKQMCQ